jgi:membrane protein DedA with SNARE-associated domain
MNHMPMIPFLIYSTIGTTLWVVFLTAAGYFLGKNYSLVEEYIAPVSKITLLALLIWFAIWIVRKRNRRYE